MDFLNDIYEYQAIIYQDAKDADYLTNPTAYKIKKVDVTSKSSLKLQLVASGGTAIHIKKL